MRSLTFLVLTLIGGFALAQGEVVATLDRQTIFEGEGVRLTVVFAGDPGTVEPDFSVLAEQFYLGGTASTSQFSFVNNQRQASTRWSIELEPRSTGEISIPPIPVGNLTTAPLKLTVMPRDQAGSGGEEVFLEMEANTLEPYVHAQVLLTVKLYHIHPLTEGRLTEPDLPHAVIERLGEDRAYPATIDGQRYRVLERRYAVFPEQSGPMTIEPIGFRGRVADRGSRFNSLFDPGRRVSVSSERLALNVRPKPPGYPAGPWLPAAELEIDESWPEGGAELIVGQPATRRIETRARGLLSVQLPEIGLPDMAELKVYPDQANSQNRTDGTWVIGEREQSYALVPTRAGSMTLPEIRVPWWDTQADRLREAVIPAREIIVGPGATPTTTPGTVTAQQPSSGRPVGQPPGRWRWIAVGSLALWLATLFAWRYERNHQGSPRKTSPTRPSDNAWRSRLKDACRDHDPSLAAAALLGWARAVHDGTVRNLGALADRVADPRLAEEIRRLDRALYAGADAPSWDGSGLWARARDGLGDRQQAKARQSTASLPPLYPETRS